MSEAEQGTLWIEPRCRPLPITDYGNEIRIVTTHNRPRPPGTPLAVSVHERDFVP